VIQLNDTDGGWTEADWSLDAGLTPSALIARRLRDGSNVDDLVVGGTFYSLPVVSILLSSGTGSFQPGESFILPYVPGATSAPQVALADVNDDGELDILALDGVPGGVVEVLQGFGDGGFEDLGSSWLGLDDGGVIPAEIVGFDGGSGRVDVAAGVEDVSNPANTVSISYGTGLCAGTGG
jgi:hypothetical protein